MVAQGKDPSVERKIKKIEQETRNMEIFRALAEHWLEKMKPQWSERHYEDQKAKLELNVMPILGNIPVASINAQIIMMIIEKIEARGVVETAKRTLTIITSILSLGVALGQLSSNPALPLKQLRLIKANPVKHHKSLDWDELPKFLLDLEKNTQRLTDTTVSAILVALHTACRPGEIINSEWNEIDFVKKIWTIPAHRMKTKIEHIVPLSNQVITLLKEQKRIAINDFVFGSVRARSGHISNMTMSVAVNRMGYNITIHGFRSFFLQHAQEKLQAPFEVADRCLAHKPPGKVRQAYDRGTYMEDRVKLMQEWSDLIDRQRARVGSAD
jgi:integrase